MITRFYGSPAPSLPAIPGGQIPELWRHPWRRPERAIHGAPAFRRGRRSRNARSSFLARAVLSGLPASRRWSCVSPTVTQGGLRAAGRPPPTPGTRSALCQRSPPRPLVRARLAPRPARFARRFASLACFPPPILFPAAFDGVRFHRIQGAFLCRFYRTTIPPSSNPPILRTSVAALLPHAAPKPMLITCDLFVDNSWITCQPHMWAVENPAKMASYPQLIHN